jgi:hypothetical protein
MRAIRPFLTVLLLCAVGGLAPACDEKSPKTKAEKLPRLEKLPADAEVHAVTISRPLHYGVKAEEITDYRGLVQALRAKDGLGAHIRKMLPAADRFLTDQAEMGLGVAGDARNARVAEREVTWFLARDLGQALERKVLYDKEAFAKVELPKAVKELVALGDKRTTFQTQRLNRELLALAFPKHIPPTPDDFQTAHVTVKPGKPVVLVLSSSRQCHWKVNVEKGVTLEGVILCGGGAQEVTGVDAPVIYRATTLPNGKRSPVGIGGFHKQEGIDYERVAKAVKEMTGRGFTTVQTASEPTLVPFVVPPPK